MASKKQNQRECTPSCRSQQHACTINAAIIRGSDAEAISFMKKYCYRACFNCDQVGRTPLHTAAACGKTDVVKWLLANGAPVNQRDQESGYTALHRALYFGHIDTAITLIRAGANTAALDNNGYMPTEQILLDEEKDKCYCCQYNHSAMDIPFINDAFVWGMNSNYNLGLANAQERNYPEFVESFHRGRISIAHASLNKFHSVFLTTNGKVYSCGHELGGRLGIETDNSVVIPQHIQALKSHKIAKISTGIDHTLFLSDSGLVFSCGLNICYQLGIVPPPSQAVTPRMLSIHRVSKDIEFIGIAASDYHSVVWTTDALYTFGLNAGQLGHHQFQNETRILAPKKVISLAVKEGSQIGEVATSPGAIVFSTKCGGIFVLNQYLTRKVGTMVNVKKIVCTGGRMNPKAGGKEMSIGEGTELKFAILDIDGFIYFWSEEIGCLKKCAFNLLYQIQTKDIAINQDNLIFSTFLGQAYTGSLNTIKAIKNYPGLKQFGFSGTSESDRFQQISIKIQRIQGLHRACRVFTDPKGTNYLAIQSDPRSNVSPTPVVSPSSLTADLNRLYEWATEGELPETDTVIKVGEKVTKVHSIMLIQRSEYLKSKFCELLNEEQEDLPVEDNPISLINTSPLTFFLDIKRNIPPIVLKEIISFIYTGVVQLISLRENITNTTNKNFNRKNNGKTKLNFTDDEKLSLMLNHYNQFMQNPYSHKIDKNYSPLAYFKDYLDLFGIFIPNKLPNWALYASTYQVPDNFIHDHCPELADVSILCEDGVTIKAHKPILYARSEYFRAMLGSPWLENNGMHKISMQIPSKVMQIVIDYIYEDKVKISTSNDVEFICDVIVVADQLLMARLKEICEYRLSLLIDLKNAADICMFAKSINAEQLCSYAIRFICRNLYALVESGALFNLSRELLKEISVDYRNNISNMQYRILTPYYGYPSSEDLEDMLKNNPVNIPDSDEEWDLDELMLKENIKQQTHTGPASSSSRKKRWRKISEGRSRKVSTSSQFSSASEGDLTQDLEDNQPLSFDDLEEITDISAIESPVMDITTGMDATQDTDSSLVIESMLENGCKIDSGYNNSLEMPPIKMSFDANSSLISEEKVPTLKHSVPKSKTDENFPFLSDSLSSPVQQSNIKPKSKKMNKLSQKQKKKLAAAQDEEKQPSPRAVKGWGHEPDKEENVLEFASIMKLQKQQSLVEKKERMPSVIQPPVKAKPTKENVWNDVNANHQVECIPWDLSNNSPSFSSILKEEKIQDDNLQKELTKPLALIQIEDKAIEDLMKFYNAENNPMERISVQRVKKSVADPTWGKQKVPKSWT